MTDQRSDDSTGDATSATPPDTPQADAPLSQTAVGDPFRVRPFAAKARPRQARMDKGRRTRSVDTPSGYAIRAVLPQEPVRRLHDVAFAATLQAAAARRAGGATSLLPLHSTDLRRQVRMAQLPNLILFVVDASGSMGARQRMSAVKGAVLSLLLDAYQKRDRVGLITFRGQGASLLLPPTNSITQASRLLAELPTGGRTPLASGLQMACQLLQQQERGTTRVAPLLVIVSDGRANVGLNVPSHEAIGEVQMLATQMAAYAYSALILDCESGYPRLGLAKQLAEALHGECVQLEEISAAAISANVQLRLARPK
jgi:magnesium chelatase subunit D